MVTVPGEQRMSPHVGGRVAESSNVVGEDRRSCKGSCNEPHDTTATQDRLSRANGKGRTPETGMIWVVPASGGGSAGSNPAGGATPDLLILL